MVNPAQALMDPSRGGQGYTMAHFPGVTMPMVEGYVDGVEEDYDGD